MTQYKITVDKDILHHLFSSNDEGMKKLLEQNHAEAYKRNDERQGY